jgi:hypothetical protein
MSNPQKFDECCDACQKTAKDYHELIKNQAKARRTDFKVKGFAEYPMVEDCCAIALFEIGPQKMTDLLITVLDDGFVCTSIMKRALYKG